MGTPKLLEIIMIPYEKLDEICTKHGYVLVCFHPLEIEDSDGYLIRGETAQLIVDELVIKSGSYVGKTYYTQQELDFSEAEPPSCLDSAYERKAIDEGMNSTPVFPENVEYLKIMRSNNDD